MASLLLSFIVFVLMAVIWTAILWFGISPIFSQWSLVSTVIAHVLPPVALWSSWLLWKRSVKRKEHLATQAQKQRSQTERQATLEEARRKREEEQKQRRFACDCKAVAISNLVVNDALELPQVEQISFQPIQVGQAHAAYVANSSLDGLELAIADALRHVYAKCAAASVFPIYVLPPSHAALDEVFNRIRAIHRQVVEELALPITLQDDIPSMRYLTAAEGVANAIIRLFDSIPDLPGTVILTFDSPLLTGTAHSAEKAGKPSHGAFAMLATHPELPSMLESFTVSISGETTEELLKPYWEKSVQVSEHLGLLKMLPLPLIAGLGRLPVLGRIHQATFGQTTSSAAVELTLLAQNLIDRAQINAGMADLPPIDDVQEDSKNAPSKPSCSWLVHNAGGTVHAGHRLAAVMTAMSYLGFDLHPVSSATNSTAQIGELNHATSLGLLALTMVQAVAQQAPALYAEFSEPSGLTVGFVVPTRML